MVATVVTGVLLAGGGAQAAVEQPSRPMRFADDRGAVLEIDVTQHRLRFDVPALPPGRAVSIDVPLSPRVDGRTTISLAVPTGGLRIGVRADPRRGVATASVVDSRSHWVAGMTSGRMVTRGSVASLATFTPTPTPSPPPSPTPYPTWTPTRTLPVVPR